MIMQNGQRRRNASFLSVLRTTGAVEAMGVAALLIMGNYSHHDDHGIMAIMAIDGID